MQTAVTTSSTSSPSTPIAYFCAEFGLSNDLPIYAGGLGILAGDTLKQAADEHVPMVGVGLLYRGDGFVQKIDETGLQTEENFNFDPVAAGLEHVYVDDMPFFVKVHLTEIDVWLRCWKKTLSPEVVLYLLDTDTDQNQLSERSITHLLYAGTEESVVKQQMLLGIGGVKLLHELNIHPRLYHVQEGRPAFLHWQLIRSYMSDHGLTFEDACNQAKSKTVYTNHTLVAAGNQSYDMNIVKRYAQYYADRMGISVDMLVQPGMESDPNRFYVTRFALNTARHASGVSQLHTKLSQDGWPEYAWSNITNGVHFGTWQSSEVARAVNDRAQLWQVHQAEKQRTMEYVKFRTGYGYDPTALVITWARRLAGYKRPDALFSDLQRLKALLTDNKRPVQLLIAGKAHRLDTAGKQMLQELIRFMQTELSGSVLFVPNYNIELAQHLVRGSDIWLNTPEMGKEACGTSGMKALSNGVLQLTVPDGWAAEVDWRDIGWELDSDHVAESIYSQLENSLIPLFFERDDQGVPRLWVQHMQCSIELSQRFSAQRMLREYQELLYK